MHFFDDAFLQKKASNYRWSYILITPVTSLVIIYALFVFKPHLPQELPFTLTIAAIPVLLFLANVIVFYVYDKQQKSYDLSFELQNMEALQVHQQELLSVQHQHLKELTELTADFQQYLAEAKKLIEQSPEQADEYLHQLTEQLQEQYQNNRSYCNNSVIDSILNYAHHQCKLYGIKMTITSQFGDLSFLDYSDSCSIFGNAIDNALTACKQLRAVNKPAELFVQISRQQKIAAITIRNDILPGSIIYQNEHFISTKTDSRFHGYGIPIMKATINRIGGSILIDYDENQFTLSILLMEH